MTESSFGFASPYTGGGGSKTMDHHFPAEWELHQRIWLSWPSPDDESPAHQQPSRSFAIRELLATLINHSVPVSLVVQDSVDQASVLSYLSNTLPSSLLETYLSFIHIPHDDIWMRDFGSEEEKPKGKHTN